MTQEEEMATPEAIESDEVVDESQADDETLVDVGESALTYFGADFDVAGLVRRLEDKDIIIPRFDPDESAGATIAGFQRQRVWSAPRMEAFIESLLLGWPVPSIFLVVEPDRRYLVLDGQQRLTSLQAFVSGVYPDGKPFALKDVAEHLKGATYSTLNAESRRRLNNTFIQATIIEPRPDDEGSASVYRLFGRLNSGGVSLTAQEIRVALFRGPVIDWIRDLNGNEDWRRLYGAHDKRLKDHEMILRALAMQEALGILGGYWNNKTKQRAAYKPPMSTFLNTYLKNNRDLATLDKDAVGGAFAEACALLVASVGREGVRYNGRLNAAHMDAVLSVLMTAILEERTPTPAGVRAGIAKLRSDEKYAEFITRSTSHRDSVVGRLQLASAALRRS